MFSTSLLPHTSDGAVHIARMAAYVKALSDGHFPVRWAGDLNYGYGLPLFNFYYQTPYLVSSIFLAWGVGLVMSFKLVLLISFLLSGIFMYAFTKELFKEHTTALLVTIFYQFAPFRFVEMFVRGGVGTVYTYSFLPLILYAITRLSRRMDKRALLFGALASGLLILSHNSLSLVFFLISLLFVFVQTKGIAFKRGLFFLLLGLLLSSFYWLPAIVEHKYTYGDLFMQNLYRTHFPPIQAFFIPNFTNNPGLRTAEVAVQFGLFHTIAIVVAIVQLIMYHQRSSPHRPILQFSLALIIGSLFFMQPISLWFWEHSTILRQFQFSWRLLAIPVFASSLAAVSLTRTKLARGAGSVAILVTLVVISTVAYWKPPEGFDRINEQEYWDYPLNTTYFGETDVIWSAGPASAYPKQRVEVIDGNATVSRVTKKTQVHTFIVEATTDARLVDRTQYFPGWRVYVDGVKVPIQFQDQNWRGLITFNVPKGSHSVMVRFGESPVRWVANFISLLTALTLVVWLFMTYSHRTHET